MRISFHGAARRVTGSKHIIHTDEGKKILLDCGMFQGEGAETALLNSHFGFNPAEIDVMVLSHAHIDHSGLIPRLVKEGFRGRIWCTPATFDLTKILLEDSARIQESDYAYLNKKRIKQKKSLIDVLYTVNDVKRSFDYFSILPYHQIAQIIDGVDLQFTDAGHIIGSAVVNLAIQSGDSITKIAFTGDVGSFQNQILKNPEKFPQADVILCESTYGNRLHDKQESSATELLNWITHTCIHKKGKLVIPAFSVGRTQEILYQLNNLELEGKLPHLAFYVDSPLSTKATEILKKHRDGYNDEVKSVLEHDEDPFNFHGLNYIESVDESKALNYKEEPCVIISASGMADAGRVKHHIANTIESPANTILMSGFCESSSLGARLQNKPEEVRIFGDIFKVRAEVAALKSMSAHGDYLDIFEFLKCQEIKEVKYLYLVHGEYDSQIEFRERLHKIGFYDIHIPDMHSTNDID